MCCCWPLVHTCSGHCCHTQYLIPSSTAHQQRPADDEALERRATRLHSLLRLTAQRLPAQVFRQAWLAVLCGQLSCTGNTGGKIAAKWWAESKRGRRDKRYFSSGARREKQTGGSKAWRTAGGRSNGSMYCRQNLGLEIGTGTETRKNGWQVCSKEGPRGRRVQALGNAAYGWAILGRTKCPSCPRHTPSRQARRAERLRHSAAAAHKLLV